MLRVLFSVVLTLAMCASARAADDPDQEIARRHFQRGAGLYESGHYVEAIGEFQAARAVMSAPALDYNIARCHDRLENLREAITYYERYLASNPPPDQDGGARARVAVLRSRLAPEPAPAPQVAAERPVLAVRPQRRYSVVAPAVVGGIALASLVTGGALYGVSGARYDDLVQSGCGSSRLCAESEWSGTRAMEGAGIGLLIAGGVVAAVDIALWGGWAVRPKERH